MARTPRTPRTPRNSRTKTRRKTLSLPKGWSPVKFIQERTHKITVYASTANGRRCFRLRMLAPNGLKINHAYNRRRDAIRGARRLAAAVFEVVDKKPSTGWRSR